VTLLAVASGLVLLALFVANERGAAQPVMPLRLFSSHERAGAYAGRLLFLGAMAPFWFFTTQFLQGVAGYSPVEAGLAFLPTTLVNFAAAMAVPRLTRRFGNATLLAGSLAISVVGMAWLSRLSADTSYLTGIALPMLLIGAGQGGALGPLTAAGISGVTLEDAGAAGGVTNVAHQLGGSLGLGILVAVFAAAGSATLHGPALLAHRIAAALTGGAVLLAVALVIALVVRPAGRSRSPSAYRTPRTTPACELDLEESALRNLTPRALRRAAYGVSRSRWARSAAPPGLSAADRATWPRVTIPHPLSPTVTVAVPPDR
ncbi:MAG TPA: MFS transporter, partial [Solirubrobacteraceae bacterium]|nr:MFS transporter [Solirubrobacteraceae bacterium]